MSISLSQGFVKGQNTANSAKDENIRDQVNQKCMFSRLRRKLLEKGGGLTLEQLQNASRSMEASDRQAGALENPNDKEGLKERLNSAQEKPERKRCYRCDMTGHTQDDKRCPCQIQRVPEMPQGRPFCKVL